MSKLQPVIIYVGAYERARALQAAAAPRTWTILNPVDLMETLGMVIFEYPDVVVIEDTPENPIGREVYMHLGSIQMENILILTDAPYTWDIPFESAVRTLPLNTRQELIIEALVGAETVVF